MRPFVRAVGIAGVLVACALIATGCGGSAEAGQGDQKGIELGFTTGRDPSGFLDKLVAKCNSSNGGKWHIKQIPLPPTVDGKREQIIRRLAAKDPSLDLLSLDVIWTAEFSDAGWLLDLSKRLEPVKGNYIPAAIDTVYYKDKYWAVPVNTQVAMLYYRTDLVKQPPKTWEDLLKQSKQLMAKHPGMAGFLWQANQYEGLTVDAMEFILAANGHVLSEDGKTAEVDKGDGAKHAFEFMRELFESGVTPKTVSTFQEEESRQMFQQGKAIFLRNWPYVFSLANTAADSKIKGKFDVVPLPAFEGRSSAGVLGGENYGISAFSDAPEETWQAMECLTSDEALTDRLLIKGDTPALESVFKDPAVVAKVPWMPTMREALNNAYPRPTTPYYNDVTVPIARVAHEVAVGHISADDAVKQLDRSVQLAVRGEGEI